VNPATLLPKLRAPHSGFRPAGAIHDVRSTSPVQISNRGRRSPRTTYRRQLGVRFERAVHEFLRKQYSGQYIANPWFSFKTSGNRLRKCSPDAIILRPGGETWLVEVKYTHTHQAWHQMLELYLPVLREYCPPDTHFSFLEVVKTASPDPLFSYIFSPPQKIEGPTVLLLPDLKL